MGEIGILLPAYNEEKNIQVVIKEARKYLPNPKIVVVDDGSTDRTNELAKKERVTVLKHDTNKGKGESLKTGFEYFLNASPEANIVVIADSDRQYSIKDSINLIKPLKNGKADFVMGCRDWNTIPFRHKLGNLVWKTTFNLLLGMSLKDTNCGFVALSRKAIKKMKQTYGGYIIENMMLVEMLKNNLRIEQVPVNVKYKGKRDIPSGIRMVLGCLIFIVKEGVKYRLGKF